MIFLIEWWEKVHNEISESEGYDYWPSEHERSESDFVDSENDAYDTVEEDDVIFVTSSVQENLGFMPNQSALVCVSSDSHNDTESLYSASSYDSTDHSKKQRFPEFNTEKDMACPSLKKNLIFATKEILRDAIRQYRRVERFSMSFKKNDNRRVHVVCSKWSCSWGCKLGFKNHCRPFISLDGCFLKGYYQGYILAAVGIDANDCIYPIAATVVESENRDSWQWFLQLLGEYLDMVNSHHVTFMSDKQKNVEGYKGKALKDTLWKAARATTVRDFDRAMSEIRGMSEDACNWLKSKDAAIWSKSHFSTRSKCDLLLNNFSEFFNKMILEARDKPILTMMEIIRTKMMHRISKNGEDIWKSSGLLCPKIQKKVDTLIRQAVRCWPSHTGGLRFEVAFGPSDQHVVDLKVRDCSCRKWGLTGIPCAHDVSVMLLIQERPDNYWEPVPSMELILPPIQRRPPGRPKKQRKKVRGNSRLNTPLPSATTHPAASIGPPPQFPLSSTAPHFTAAIFRRPSAAITQVSLLTTSITTKSISTFVQRKKIETAVGGQIPPPQQQPTPYHVRWMLQSPSPSENTVMQDSQESISSFTVIGAEAPSACHMAPRTENADQIVGGITVVNVLLVSDGLTGSTEKKKRGRPRKYGPDGTMTRALSPMSISSFILPVSGEFSSGGKQGKGRGSGYQIKHHKGMEMENLGDLVGTSVGTNFTPHIITVNPSEVCSNTGKRRFC
ncbi:hypothetical protein F3Y22_tig00111780pilonHSYRG00002 [Hibiscus syriacus]|uniref:SWIM-type domain-containing protein n=1 Tax=Hibiscus syriacus TaxID=106335 RepID=A0A6A2XCQ2_HIBSY|nr:hypothetical protein F3Y22_tig00111780pilonHSYRG00002 [Hibiscus syriacus]